MLTTTSILSLLPFYEYFSGGEVGFSKSFDVVSYDFEKENPSFISKYKIESSDEAGVFGVSIV